jgi:hypothetical protein
MNEGTPIFSQLIQFLDRKLFQKCVNRYGGSKGIKVFSCWDQFLCLAFAQLTYRDSLRDIEACLNGSRELLYRMGFRCKRISRSTISRANRDRDSRIFEDFAWLVIAEAKRVMDNREASNLPADGMIFALDSTIVDLCLSLFPWAKFRSTKAGVKIHTLLDLRLELPHFIDISAANLHDTKILPKIPLVPGAYYIMDRAYLAFKYLRRLELIKANFIVRLKENTKLRRLYSNPVNKSSGVISDHVVRLVLPTTRKKYPHDLRRIRYRDPDTKKIYQFLTNNFEISAKIICDLYRARWRIEIFFKWIKQNLRIKTFFGTTENAVRSQIWVAITTYALAIIVKSKLQISHELYIVLQVLSVMPFDKKPIKSVFQEMPDIENFTHCSNQLDLFNI